MCVCVCVCVYCGVVWCGVGACAGGVRFSNSDRIISQQIEYFIRPIKQKNAFLVNCWPSGKYVNLLYMYSILGRGSFCFNYCLNSVWLGGDQFVAQTSKVLARCT